ncbi:Hypothetical predicted protein [Mytilus galloprovincialis]|uniref:Uncharacterized protein n=1 Tax=Mytilus galloprovincialis TaxID=29158 RepID=A0A8B6GLZ6_MYTGA|nr:Hypothetical predicted protein [Mytilus galloprovincialis]
MKTNINVLNVLLFLLLINFSSSAHPTGCSYDGTLTSTGLYTCDLGSYTAPLAYSSFSSPLPQRLKITGVTGTFTSQLSGFSSFSTGSFDANYPASLELECLSSNSLTLSSVSFTDMGYLQEVKFSFCNIVSLTSGMLSPFGTLNSLRFEGGSIASYSNSFLTGLIVEPVTSTPEPKGELVIRDCTITPTSIPAGTFDVLTTVKSIRVENAGVTAVDSSLYNLAVAVDDVSLADNSITTLDSAVFSSLKGLSDINLDGIPYDCTCSSLVFLQSLSQNSIRSAGPICNTPAAYQNKKATKYYADSCDLSVSCADIAIGSTCMTVYELVGSILSFVTLVLAAIALVIICHTRRQLMAATSNLEKNRNSGWSKAKDAMDTNRSIKPPMRGSQAVHGWG